MNLNPLSPFSGKPLSEIDAREGDAWCAQIIGYSVEAPGALQQGVKGRWWMRDMFMGVPIDSHSEVPQYSTLWAAAGPLMEREEWSTRFSLNKNLNGQSFSVYDDLGQGNYTHLATCDSAPLTIRNAFIIAATHAQEQQP